MTNPKPPADQGDEVKNNAPTPMVYQCCGREICDGKECPNNGPWGKTPKWRMDAYYYGFELTGFEAIDKILSAVACAGKCFHQTEDWTKPVEGYYSYHSGESCADWIQNAANEAAAVMAENAAMQAKLDEANPFSDADQRDLNIGRAIQRAAMELPSTSLISIDIGLGEGFVSWFDEYGDGHGETVESGEPFSAQIHAAIDASIASVSHK